MNTINVNDLVENNLKKGNDLFAQTKYREAIECFENALLCSPNRLQEIESQFKKGRCFVKLRKRKEAIESYDQVLSVDPENLSALNFKGFTLSELKAEWDAKKVFDLANQLNSNPNNTEKILNKGLSLNGL